MLNIFLKRNLILPLGQHAWQCLKDKNVLAVSGTHGKTTTAAMLCKIMHDKYKDMGYLVGGVAQDLEDQQSLEKVNISLLKLMSMIQLFLISDQSLFIILLIL